MGYGTYERHDGRMGGYNVQAVCDLPGCDTIIDRGMSYLCGSSPDWDGDWTCGGCFCSDHLVFSHTDDAGQMCPDCSAAQKLALDSQAGALFDAVKWCLTAAGITTREELPDPPRRSYSSEWRPNPFDLIAEEPEYEDPQDFVRVLQDEAGELYDMTSDLQTFVPVELHSSPAYDAIGQLRQEMIESANEAAWKLRAARAEAAKEPA